MTMTRERQTLERHAKAVAEAHAHSRAGHDAAAAATEKLRGTMRRLLVVQVLSIVVQIAALALVLAKALR